MKLDADGIACGNSPRPMHDQRRANASAMGILLVPFERRVGGLRPSRGIMIESALAADIVQTIEADLWGFLLVDHVLAQVERAGWTSFRACAVVREQNDQRVVETPERFEIVDQPAD